MKKQMRMILAITAVTVVALLSVNVAYGRELTPKERERGVSVVAKGAVLSATMTTNFSHVVNIMDESAVKSWVEFGRLMKIEDNQCFYPDFFKVQSALIGGYDENGFVMALYNPFYDAFWLLLVNDSERVRIKDCKFVRANMLLEKGIGAVGPVVAGGDRGDRYFKDVLDQVSHAADVFKLKFLRKDYESAFASVVCDVGADAENFMVTMKLRMGQALALADKSGRVFRDSVLATAVLNDEKLANGKMVSSDPSTKRVLELVFGKIAAWRKSFHVVSCFPTSDETNVIFGCWRYPTLLLQANVSKEGRVWLKMLDLHLAVEFGFGRATLGDVK